MEEERRWNMGFGELNRNYMETNLQEPKVHSPPPHTGRYVRPFLAPLARPEGLMPGTLPETSPALPVGVSGWVSGKRWWPKPVVTPEALVVRICWRPLGASRSLRTHSSTWPAEGEGGGGGRVPQNSPSHSCICVNPLARDSVALNDHPPAEYCGSIAWWVRQRCHHWAADARSTCRMHSGKWMWVFDSVFGGVEEEAEAPSGAFLEKNRSLVKVIIIK